MTQELTPISDPASTDAPQRQPTLRTASALVRRIMIVLLFLLLGGVLFFWTRQNWMPYEYHGSLIDPPLPAADFVLDTSVGKPMHLRDFAGKYTLLFFGYTYCPDACPMTLNDLAKVRKQVDPAGEKLQVILVTTDPARDTPERLAAYLSVFDPTFLGMTGTTEATDAVAAQFGIFVQRHAQNDNTTTQSKTTPDSYFVDHTSVVIVLDPSQNAHLIFPYGITDDEMVSDLNALMR